MRGSSATATKSRSRFAPGEVTKIEYVMPDVLHTFRAGHRIMVQIQSSWFPLVNLNPQTFVNIQHGDGGGLQARDAARLPVERRGVAHHAARARGF